MLGYGLIASEDIDEGLHRLRTSSKKGLGRLIRHCCVTERDTTRRVRHSDRR
jgi:hypothetical protein